MKLLQHPVYKWLFYLLYALVLTIILLIVRFPKKTFKTMIVNTIERSFPGAQCRLGKIGYQFPLSFKITELDVKSLSESKSILELENILIQPKLKNPFQYFTLSMNGYDSEHKCNIQVDTKDDKFFVRDLLIDQLDLGKLSYVQYKLGRKLSGIITITGDFTAQLNSGKGIAGRGKVKINDGKLELLRPILFQKTLDMKKVEANYTITGETLEFSNGQFDGNQLKGDFNGNMGFRTPWTHTSLNLKGKLIAKATVFTNNPRASRAIQRLRKQHKSSTPPFIIKGELGKPSFRFGF